MKMENKYTELISKICLGTAQLGMDYGIANKTGKPDTNEINNILNFALESGIVSLDTAHSYGNSEKAIGEFVKNNDVNFKIISKLPPLTENIDIEKNVFESLSRLNINSIYGYLIHKFDDFLNHPSLWDNLESLKQKKIIQKIGFSIYTIDQLEVIMDKVKVFDIIQIPYSVFDRRFVNYLPILKKRKVEIHIRSVFLQGLAFLKHYNLPQDLLKAKESLECLQNLSETEAISINALCLNFVLLNSYIDKVIVGVDNSNHLVENIKSIKLSKKVEKIMTKLDKLEIKEENIILPYKWENK